jgi:hypothetical protein
MKKRLVRVLIINISIVIIFIAYYLISTKTNIYIPCLFRLVTGLKCPGCGITHYFFDIIHLDFNSAFMDNPLVFIYVPIFLVYYVISNYCYIKYNNRNKIVMPKLLTYCLLVIAILFGIFRNIWNF